MSGYRFTCTPEGHAGWSDVELNSMLKRARRAMVEDHVDAQDMIERFGRNVYEMARKSLTSPERAAYVKGRELFGSKSETRTIGARGPSIYALRW